jgi:hypothetical protein
MQNYVIIIIIIIIIAFENRVVRRIFGPQRGKMTGGWRKLHNVELHNMDCWSIILRTIKSRWAGDVARIGESRNACGIFVGKSEGKRPVERPRHRWWIVLR